jgi:hypothetical protein
MTVALEEVAPGKPPQVQAQLLGQGGQDRDIPHRVLLGLVDVEEGGLPVEVGILGPQERRTPRPGPRCRRGS